MVVRIGEFSQYFDVPSSTVRYYIKYGLLLPDVVNKQNLFDESCVQDMEHILEWKEMNFSLESILELLTIERKARLSLVMDTERLAVIYLEHKKLLLEHLQTVDRQTIHLDELIAEVEAGILP